ncbi:MerR family transcriptional regulator [Mycobacterium sp. 94-17]|uniref:MerR family transcriptional regulator n=1 Tax=Mycobacterium sp. 94-17 TaxID=2986147 RepID=UPI002D1ED7E6|nr:MerR family transcriptional regulator [Mycobacterium sp. 94-17]MEB4209839.1 MerR family transcriptional regulator [Mycobacterium sp. 94-17]
MRLADLSARSGVASSTIKYYLRAGLLHSGHQQSSTWSTYDDSHLRRLALIRALSEVAGLPLESVRRVLEVVNDESVPLHDALGTAQWLLSPVVAEEPSARSARRVDAFLARHQWELAPDSPHRRVLADALDRLDQLAFPVPDSLLDQYAAMVSALAPSEVEPITTDTDRAAAIEHLVIGTLLYEPVLTTMRRMAHESDSTHRSKPS